MDENKKKKTGEYGSLMVDTACSLPVFIIVFSVFLSLITRVGMEETTSHCQFSSAFGKAAVLAASTYAEQTDSSVYDIAVTAACAGELNSLLKTEWPDFSGISSFRKENGVRVWIEDFRPAVSLVCSDGGSLDNLICFTIAAEPPIPFSFLAREQYVYENTFLFRPFIGAGQDHADGEDQTVYVFPRRGEKYHHAGCSCLRNGSVSSVLNADIRQGYHACELCHPDLLPLGASVFLYSAFSHTYHRKSCSVITKYYEAISMSDAVSMGYTPCMLCCSGGDSRNE